MPEVEFDCVFEKRLVYWIGRCPSVDGSFGKGKTFETCRISLVRSIQRLLEKRVSNDFTFVIDD